MVAFANLLPAEVYGSYQFVLSVSGILTVFSLPGLKSALVRSVPKGNEGSFPLAFWVRMRWSILTSIALACIGLWYFFEGEMILLGAFLVAALLFPLRLTESVSGQFWQEKKLFSRQIIIHLIVSVGAAAVGIATLWFTDNLIYIILAFFGVQAVLGIGVYVYSVARMENRKVDSDMVRYGKSLTLMSAIGTIADHPDRILLFAVLPPAQLAIYSFAIDPVKKAKSFCLLENWLFPK